MKKEILYNVPFYGNLTDDHHCAQATLRSVLKYFQPEKEFAWEELDKATAKLPGKGSWRMAGLLWLRENGYEVHDISTLDYGAFAERGLAYLAEHYSPQAAAWEAENFNIPAEQERARHFMRVTNIQNRIPLQKDIERFLDAGYLVQVTVNIVRLNNSPNNAGQGYRGHAILVIGYTDEVFIAHDPGLPPYPYRHIARNDFEAAWADPAPRAKVITAAKLLESDPTAHPLGQ